MLGSVGLCLAFRHVPLGLCLGGALLAFATGFAAAKLRTEMARAPVLAHELRYVAVTGFIEAHELRGKGRARLTLRVLSLSDLGVDQRPYRLRVSLPAGDVAGNRIGEAVTLRATLQPPPEPVEPGGFDFARQAWFARLGATGYATSKVTLVENQRATPWDLEAWAQIDAVRAAVNARIRAALPGETGEIAAALITGERGGIPEQVTQAMRDSGLAHILSISGLVAAPLISLLIMPMALLSLIAMPFGLETLPLQAMGLGIELMVATGHWVASFPGAVSVLPQISGWALVLIVLGGLWLCLWQTRTRALGLVIAAAGLALAPQSERPDVLIERDGGTAALRSSTGNLVFPPATAAGYSVDNWLLADGDERDVASVADEGVFRCDSLGCIGVVKGKTVALVRHPGALEEDCRLADIVIAPFTIGKKCRAARVIVDRRMLKAYGAHALYIEGLSIRTETVAAARGKRPWTPDRAMIEIARPAATAEPKDQRLDGDPEE